MYDLLVDVMSVLLFISIFLLICGIGTWGFKAFRHQMYCGLGYFLILLLFEIVSYLLSGNNLFMLSISSFVNFAFLTYFYCAYFFKKSIKKIIPIILIGTIPMIISLILGYSFQNFQSYDRALYSFAIMLLSLYYFYWILNENEKASRESIILNSFVLLFFSIDTFLAVGTNYLINENLMLVAWFWFFRAIFLQLYYGSLIYYSWQIGKTQ